MRIRKVLSRDILSLEGDLLHHFLYTVFIISMSGIITCILVFIMILQNSRFTKTVFHLSLTPTPPFSIFYTERGSPYDRRMVNGEDTNVIFHGPRDKKEIALTFDAEMTDEMRDNVLSRRVPSSYDKRITDILDKTQTKATLFLTGMWIELYKNETTELSQDTLFELGSHSYTDSSYNGYCYGLEKLTPALKIEDIGVTEKLLREYAHIDNQLFRFPGGCYSPEDVKLVNQAGDRVVHWDVVGADGFNDSTNLIIQNVVSNTQNGSIIVLHMNGWPTAPHTADALPSIIAQLKGKGFTFVTISELLGLPPEKRIGT